jgi:hypothetical protein
MITKESLEQLTSFNNSSPILKELDENRWYVTYISVLMSGRISIVISTQGNISNKVYGKYDVKTNNDFENITILYSESNTELSLKIYDPLIKHWMKKNRIITCNYLARYGKVRYLVLKATYFNEPFKAAKRLQITGNYAIVGATEMSFFETYDDAVEQLMKNNNGKLITK